MHGLDQSEALTRAAQKLSAARADLSSAAVLDPYVNMNTIVRLQDRLETAELAYRAAYKAYTNPFGVEKTV